MSESGSIASLLSGPPNVRFAGSFGNADSLRSAPIKEIAGALSRRHLAADALHRGGADTVLDAGRMNAHAGAQGRA
jgi:hypothetical protein